MKVPVLLVLLTAVPVFAQTGATPAEKLTVAPGFKVELLKSADTRDGSWISMAIDAKGRLYISPQGAIPESGFAKDSKWGGLVRVTLENKGQIAKWERVPVPVGDAMGMLWAFDSLYVSGQGPEGRGIYRLRDTDGDDTLDTAPLWKAVPGGAGEHGAHALVLGPDGKSIYIVHGNSTPLIDGIAPDSPYKNYREDDLLPPLKDPVATFFDKIKAPYGYVLRTDEYCTKWELLAGGFRNPYDLDFNADGELFTYDSDMEWDVGLPWYRPTRVLHVVPGGEYGFREGSAKWPSGVAGGPPCYPDSLPAAVDIGLGCPTGVKFGTKSHFPEKYRRAFFIMDWTFGRILAVHLHPRGASYTAKNAALPPYKPTGPTGGEDVEVFLTGKGLPVTDLEFGNDGAMYFTIGGRGTQAGLYRVSWTGENPTRSEQPAVSKTDIYTSYKELLHGAKSAGVSVVFSREPASAARLLVAMVELPTALKSTDPQMQAGLAKIAPHLFGAADPFVSTEMRRQLESVPSSNWRELALQIDEPRAALSALLALARVGTKEDQAAILQALAKFPLDALSEELKLDKLRVIEVALARHGRPNPELVAMGLEKLSRQYPAQTFALNRELCQLLVFLSQQPAGGGGQRAGVGASDAGKVASDPAKLPSDSAPLPSEVSKLASDRTALPSGRAKLGSDPASAPSDAPKLASEEAKLPSDGGKLASEQVSAPSDRPKLSSDLDAARPAPEALVSNIGTEIIIRTLDLMDASLEPAEQIWYALCLREAAGWTPAQRERYFAWFAKAKGYKGGNSLAKFILRIRDQALEKVPAAERAALLALAEKDLTPANPVAAPLPPRSFVKAWTLDDLLPALPEADKGRNFARGKALYTAAQCAQCHQFAGEGGATGPDLTALGGRFSRKDMLEAILEPSKALSEQYASFLFTLKDGSMVGGQIADENNDHLALIVDPIAGTRQTISPRNIVKREMSPVSLMPPGLLATLTKEEVLDLLAYLESAGNEKAPAFAQ